MALVLKRTDEGSGVRMWNVWDVGSMDLMIANPKQVYSVGEGGEASGQGK